jgi:hypothetical protein
VRKAGRSIGAETGCYTVTPNTENHNPLSGFRHPHIEANFKPIFDCTQNRGQVIHAGIAFRRQLQRRIKRAASGSPLRNKSVASSLAPVTKLFSEKVAVFGSLTGLTLEIHTNRT